MLESKHGLKTSNSDETTWYIALFEYYSSTRLAMSRDPVRR